MQELESEMEKALKNHQENPNGAKVRKSCSARKMLQNEDFVAKLCFDTAENEPSKLWPACTLPPTPPPPWGRRNSPRPLLQGADHEEARRHLAPERGHPGQQAGGEGTAEDRIAVTSRSALQPSSLPLLCFFCGEF